jgi:hypothetical protein
MHAGKTRLATILASLIVLAAILWPAEDIPVVPLVGLDKAVHVLLFGLWALALRLDWRVFRERPLLLVATVALAALLTEAMQLFVPGRSFDFADMAADFAGGVLAAAFGGPLARRADRLFGGSVPDGR